MTRPHICQMLIENADENNPCSKLSRCTPLHLAAYSGHFSTFKLIFDWALQKQPKGIHAKPSQEFSLRMAGSTSGSKFQKASPPRDTPDSVLVSL